MILSGEFGYPISASRLLLHSRVPLFSSWSPPHDELFHFSILISSRYLRRILQISFRECTHTTKAEISLSFSSMTVVSSHIDDVIIMLPGLQTMIRLQWAELFIGMKRRFLSKIFVSLVHFLTWLNTCLSTSSGIGAARRPGWTSWVRKKELKK